MFLFVQLLCVLMMLTLGGALTEEQLSKVLAALPQVDDVKVRRYLYRLVSPVCTGSSARPGEHPSGWCSCGLNTSM